MLPALPPIALPDSCQPSACAQCAADIRGAGPSWRPHLWTRVRPGFKPHVSKASRLAVDVDMQAARLYSRSAWRGLTWDVATTPRNSSRVRSHHDDEAEVIRARLSSLARRAGWVIASPLDHRPLCANSHRAPRGTRKMRQRFEAREISELARLRRDLRPARYTWRPVYGASIT